MNPKKEMDFPSVKSTKMPSRSKSHTALRINTTKQDLQDRYLSSEEEPSPSPDDGPHDFDHELKDKPDIFIDHLIDVTENIQTEIATPMTILALGRPKLIDITNLAPMHKRKRLAKSPFPHPVPKIGIVTPASAATAASNGRDGVDENQSHPTPDRIPAVPKPPRQQLRRKESFSMHAPESWLPEEAEEEEQRHVPSLRPSANRNHPRRDRHLPLDTSRRPSSRSAHAHHFSTRVLDSDLPLRPHTPSSPMPSPSPSAAWKGFTRSLSMAKRHSGSTVGGQQGMTKRPKMIPRGANEREDIPVIPPFPFEGSLVAA